jgi:hypothetical protein
VPHVGLTFDSVNATKNYYNSYARYKGFGTKFDTITVSQQGAPS